MRQVDVNGKQTHPVFQFLKVSHVSAKSGLFRRRYSFGNVRAAIFTLAFPAQSATESSSNQISWNFGTKFLVSRDGTQLALLLSH